jgi:hypothetical protein
MRAKSQKIKIGLLLFLSALVVEISGQNFIGMHMDNIKEVMKKNSPMLKLNTNVVNHDYKYLKYEDKINEITVLFFLSEDDKCTMVRKMCDYANINDEIQMLNTKYKPAGKNTWLYEEGGKKYLVTLEEGEWYFTITTKLKK